MYTSQIQRATLCFKKINFKDIFIPLSLRNKVIKYHRLSDERKIFFEDLTQKRKKKLSI